MVSNSKLHYTKIGDERRTVFYSCGTFTASGHSVCSWHTIDEMRLKLLVANEIRRQAEKIHLDKAAVIAGIANYDKERLEGLRQEIEHTSQHLQELTERSAKLYEDKVSGVLDRKTFVLLMRQNEQERSRNSERLQNLKADLAALEQSAAAAKQWAAGVSKYLNLQDIDRAVIDELIDHIKIGERAKIDGKLVQDIKVVYRFVGSVD